MNDIKIAFYKGEGLRRDKFVRWWTGSPYSHVEIILPTGMMAGIRPPYDSVIRKRSSDGIIEDDWEIVELPVTKGQFELIKEFIKNTTGHGYDWIGMIASHLMPFKVSVPNKWYCSEWVAYALAVSKVIPKKQFDLLKLARIPPGKLYKIIKSIGKKDG